MAKLTKKYCLELARILKKTTGLKGSIKDLSNHLFGTGLGVSNFTQPDLKPTLMSCFVWRMTKQDYKFWLKMNETRIIPKY